MTPKQITFLTELLRCGTVKEAYQKAGVSEATAYRWLREDKGFKEELQKRKTEMLNDVSITMQVGFSDAVNELLEIIRKPDASYQVKINAIDCLFRNARPIIEEVDILNRLQAVEESLKEGDEDNT